MRHVPGNEEFVLKGCATGELSIDEQGRIWRHKQRKRVAKGDIRLLNVRTRRAEQLCSTGYLRVSRQENGQYRFAAASRMVWRHFHGKIAQGLYVNHKNGLKTDNRPINLELTTPQENTLHAARIGLWRATASRVSFALLARSPVARIRAEWDRGGTTQRELARRYGTCPSNISRILSGRTWKPIGSAAPIQKGVVNAERGSSEEAVPLPRGSVQSTPVHDVDRRGAA